MLEKFKQLDLEKQENILRASIRQFAVKGYKDASTNKIVEDARISKGTLFYYFKNKKGLYHYLIDYALNVIEKEYIDHIDYETIDLIERIENNSKIKYQYFQKFPEVNQFLTMVLYSEYSTLSSEHQEKFSQLMKVASEKVNNNKRIETEFFKEGIDPEKASRIIEFSIEGYFSELTKQFNQKPVSNINMDELWEDFDDFLHSLREVFYEENLE